MKKMSCTVNDEVFWGDLYKHWKNMTQNVSVLNKGIPYRHRCTCSEKCRDKSTEHESLGSYNTFFVKN